MTKKTIVVAKSSDLASGAMLPVIVDYTDVVIFRDESGAVHALADRCSHADVKLSEGSYDGGEVVECPAHGAKFSVCSGSALCMPAIASVQTFDCSENNGEIAITYD